jgi:putative glutamine amidotransferase
MSTNERPLIGINGVLIAGDSPQLKLATRYANAVLKAGGIPVALAPIGGPGDIERLLERIDGLLLSGGDDFDTLRLGLGPVHPAAELVPSEKQDWDFELARRAIALDVPVLGICYGMQLLGLLEGAHIHQHLPDDRPGSREHRGGVEHAVAIEPESKLARILGEREVTVVSRHHQALSQVEPPWSVNARDDERLIEGIERARHPFAIGVQWHPELAPEGSAHDRLFRALVGAAAIRATRRALTTTAHLASARTTLDESDAKRSVLEHSENLSESDRSRMHAERSVRRSDVDVAHASSDRSASTARPPTSEPLPATSSSPARASKSRRTPH